MAYKQYIISSLEAAKYLNITTNELSKYAFSKTIDSKLVPKCERFYTREELNRFKREVLDLFKEKIV